MQHIYNVLETRYEAATTYWTPWCSCGWVGVEGPTGKAADTERHRLFLEHLQPAP